MPKRTDLQGILILGSGPIVIGQAAEFETALALWLCGWREKSRYSDSTGPSSKWIVCVQAVQEPWMLIRNLGRPRE